MSGRLPQRVLDGSYWRTPSERPRLNDDYIFIADALERVGSETPEWTGDEISVMDNQSDDPRYERLQTAMRLIADAGRNEHVKTYLWRPGTAVKEAPVEIWHGSVDRLRFAQCTADDRGHKALLFFKTDSLARLLAKVNCMSGPIPPNSDIPLFHLSPYLKLMLAVVEQLGVTKDNQPKKLQVEHAIAEIAPHYGLECNPHVGNASKQVEKKAWQPRKGLAVLGETAQGVMATFIREISGQNMRGG